MLYINPEQATEARKTSANRKNRRNNIGFGYRSVNREREQLRVLGVCIPEDLTWTPGTIHKSRNLLQVNHRNILTECNTAWCSSCSALRKSPQRVEKAARHNHGGVPHPALKEGGRTDAKQTLNILKFRQ